MMKWFKNEMKKNKEFNSAIQGIMFFGVLLIAGLIFVFWKYIIIGMLGLGSVYVFIKFYKPIKSFITKNMSNKNENK